jgi:hypothetical protein
LGSWHGFMILRNTWRYLENSSTSISTEFTHQFFW